MTKSDAAEAAPTGKAGTPDPAREALRVIPGGARAPSSADIATWSPVLDRLGIGNDTRNAIAARARTNRTSFEAELLASEQCTETRFFQAVAQVLGLDFIDEIDPDALVLRDSEGLGLLRNARGIRIARFVADEERTHMAAAPDAEAFRRLRTLLGDGSDIGERLFIATPTAMRAAVEKRCMDLISQRASSDLADALPYCSSRTVLTGPQGLIAGFLVTLTVVSLVLFPLTVTFIIHLFSTLFFMGCVILRVAAITSARRGRRSALKRADPAELPRYTVLVALYQEVEMVPQLLRALGKLVWPATKLEIKLVCEADDHATIAAIEAHELAPSVEIVKVPRSHPRTKPKALAHALQLSTGDYVALYDAEDKPHPLQLLEAWQRFEESDPALACVQAPLVITNGDRSLLARLFAFEYSALFRGVLPFLSSKGLILPLGGTSNHFRRNALEKMGAWDPYNVTEDADLGLRMVRFGYRTETIDYPTYEVAPENWKDWRNQRTRWFKGWIQTWLVHMREPGRLLGELGLLQFVVAQILFAGLVASALVHPLLIATIAWLTYTLAVTGTATLMQPALIGLDFANILLGYTAYFMLGRATLPRDKRRGLLTVGLLTPVYWFMHSIAAWRALFQLTRDPHLWEKTPHPAEGEVVESRQ